MVSARQELHTEFLGPKRVVGCYATPVCPALQEATAVLVLVETGEPRSLKQFPDKFADPQGMPLVGRALAPLPQTTSALC